MTLRQLKYFIEVVNAGSINKASDNLFITQPSLSSAIKELEVELGLELFLRNPKGISLTEDGSEFLRYARQVVEQASLMEQRFLKKQPSRRLFAVSAQHYAFVVKAFANMVGKVDAHEYEFTLRETRTYEILEDVKNMRSEIGILYTNPFNERIIRKLLGDDHLDFHPLFIAKPHIFTSSNNPLARRDFVTLDDLEDYPCLTHEQGTYNSFYFAEEMQSTVYHRKNIVVNDRATMLNLMIALNGYTISSGLINSEFNGENIVAIPLMVDDLMTVGYITNVDAGFSNMGEMFLDELMIVIRELGIELIP